MGLLCILDFLLLISDGIKKKILTTKQFSEEFLKTWNSEYPNITLPVKMPKDIRNFNRDISIPWSKIAMKAAIENYIVNNHEFYNGTSDELIPEDGIGLVLKTVKKVSKKILYSSIEAESIELTGFAIITGIFKHYSKLLKMSYETFQQMVKAGIEEDFDVERRLYNRIGKRYVAAYCYAVDKLDLSNANDFEMLEWWIRVHLIVDHISGMTDKFALETYQMLEGINLMKL